MWYDCIPDKETLTRLIGATRVGESADVPDAEGDLWYDCSAVIDPPRSTANTLSKTERPAAVPPPQNWVGSHLASVISDAQDPFGNRERFTYMTDKVLPNRVVDILNKGFVWAKTTISRWKGWPWAHG